MKSTRSDGVEGGSTVQAPAQLSWMLSWTSIKQPLLLPRVAECRDTHKLCHGTRGQGLPLGKERGVLCCVARSGINGQRGSKLPIPQLRHALVFGPCHTVRSDNLEHLTHEHGGHHVRVPTTSFARETPTSSLSVLQS